MSASPNIFWKTSHHFAVKRQYIIFVKQRDHISVGDASFYQIFIGFYFRDLHSKIGILRWKDVDFSLFTIF
jgi:hypothetical protein